MSHNEAWETWVKRMLKAELKSKGFTYSDLVNKLYEIGIVESEPNIRNKISRGKFSAVFLLQCHAAMGSESIIVPRFDNN
jgi:hypothetical protein